MRFFLIFCLLSTAFCAVKFAGDSEVHDEAHIKQHLENKIEVEKLTEDQQKFHYFSMHDLNKDNQIDGIEIMKAITHDHSSQTELGHGLGNPVTHEEEMIGLVDSVLHDLDANNDGFIDYAEYNRKR
ncbi:unnamed protein product [Caenorhabditis auriculariae]|uniref:EF-hand domain-containing protein n=1 Tax=Caenorhabditis auriculariae TaxID=2777116 RepID=A0A8S1GTE1_9PELO|nr:unnamed protein product [Caenorhabditis auriculariae]